MAIQDYDRAI
jgi:Flp pilus assembly protein TadD